jgi:hypothetical protein
MSDSVRPEGLPLGDSNHPSLRVFKRRSRGIVRAGFDPRKRGENGLTELSKINSIRSNKRTETTAYHPPHPRVTRTRATPVFNSGYGSNRRFISLEP